ncbi:MAG: tetratricopeptide repeat protein [Cyanobacteriota bacterium]|nr:tetratricopeptide repeat protein [Cyanobacteriota bacterium]
MSATSRLAYLVLLLGLAGGISLPIAWAAPSGWEESAPSESETTTNYEQGAKAVKAKNWSSAITHLEKAVAEDPQNADAWNYLAYSYRQQGNLDKAFAGYAQALKWDPDHKQALEYLGEAYLQANNLPQAEAQLQRLQQICGNTTCEEYQDLAEAIQVFKTKL